MRIVKAVQLSICAVFLCVAFGANTNADMWNKRTVVTFSHPIEVPGHVLPAGTYVFELLNSPSDRHIVQIWNEDGTQLITTTIAVPDYRMNPYDKTVFTFHERSADSPMALQTWFYPGDPDGQQFVYPRHLR